MTKLKSSLVMQVTVSECSGGIGTMLEKAASVNPQATHIFVFKIHAFKHGGGKNYCLGKPRIQEKNVLRPCWYSVFQL